MTVLAELQSGMSSVVYTTVRAWAVSGKGALNPMSAFGTKRTFQSRSAMSAIGGKADIAVDIDQA